MNTNARNVSKINKEKMIQALIILLKLKPFNQITISEISQEAKVSKRTFYRAFHSKEEVLASYGLDSFNQYIATIKQFNQPDFFQIIQGLFEFWYHRREIVKILIDQRIFNLVFEQLQSELVSTYLSLNFSWHQVTNDNEIHLLMQFMLGGITEIIRDWLKVPNPVSPVVMTGKFKKIIKDIQIL